MSYSTEHELLQQFSKAIGNCTVRNVRQFRKFLCYKGNVQFDDIYYVFEQRYLKIVKNVLNFYKMYLKTTKL